MAEVNLLIHGRTYGVGCDEGQEKRVRELGQYIDKRIKDIAGVGGTATEAHLLVLTALVLADELFEARELAQPLRAQVSSYEEDISTLRLQLEQALNQDFTGAAEPTVANELDKDTEAKIATAISTLAGRLDQISKRLQAA